MMKSRATWRSKLEKPQEPKVVKIPPKMRKNFGTGSMLIPRPLDVDALIRTVPKGSLVTVSRLRARLARDHRVDVACPLTTGIFLRISAETAEEDARAGAKTVTPWWRVIGDDGKLKEKLPRGQAARLKSEGHTIVGGRVKDFEPCLVEL